MSVVCLLSLVGAGCGTPQSYENESGGPSDAGGEASDPGPSDPGPSDPGPSDPGPSDPGPSDPGPSDPGPSDPGPGDADAGNPAPGDPGPPLVDAGVPGQQRPNILLILADDLGYADVGFNGSPDIVTPQLDTLAKGGVTFSSAYVVHPFCGPSRMGLFSGRYPHEFGGPYNLPNYSTGNYANQGMPTNEVMISKVLQNAGYVTGLMGKWHLGQKPKHHPNQRGYDDFYGFLGGGKKYFGPYIAAPAPDYSQTPQHNGVYDSTLTANDYITDVLSNQGVRFLNDVKAKNDAEATDSPFFLVMSYNAPHTPLEAKAADKAQFPALQGARQTYAGMVYAMDRGVGQLTDALRANGQLDNTLIVFLSDNGGRTDQGGNNAPLRGRKGDTTEGGVRVPMFMHWPKTMAAGQVYEHPVTALDLYPTFARLGEAQVPAGKNLDGKDISTAVVQNQNARAGSPIYSVRYQSGFGNTGATSVGIRQDQWKAVRVPAGWSLYNVVADIGEKNDVSAQNPAILQDLVAKAGIWAKDHVTPLWYDSPEAEQTWIDRGMPQYGNTFTLP